MIRNLKALGLALAALFAMNAIVASMASADDLTSESSPVTLTGKQVGAGDVFTTEVGTGKCKESNYTATVTTATTTVSVTPSYPAKTTGGEQNCVGFGFPAEVNTNSCTYLFHIGAATTGTLDVICPAGNEITMTATSAGTVKCTFHLPPQTGKSTVTYKNVGGARGTREIEIEANITTFTYSWTKGTGLGACSVGGAPSGEKTTGGYAGRILFTGERDNGGNEHVGVFLS